MKTFSSKTRRNDERNEAVPVIEFCPLHVRAVNSHETVKKLAEAVLEYHKAPVGIPNDHEMWARVVTLASRFQEEAENG